MTRYHWKRDGVLRIADDGAARFLTLFETVAFLLGGKP